MNLKQQIDLLKIPSHVAVIMDGNGRWAKKNGRQRIFGHRNAIKAIREITEGCAEVGIKYLTLYAFSTENWERPRLEVNALMSLLVETIRSETKTLMKNGVRLQVIGDTDKLPSKCKKELLEAIEITKNNPGLTLILALSYSSRWEISNALKNIVSDTVNGKIDLNDINEKLIDKYLCTNNIPDPELLIRTSGEYRISNFLLWQIAYAELYFTNTLWPDFRKEDLWQAILDYQRRERRFGKTSEQLINK